MAVVRNITKEALSLLDGVQVGPGKEHSVDDEQFVNRAWPKSTWTVVKKPSKDYVEQPDALDDAHVFVSKDEATPAETSASDTEEGA